MKRQISGWVGKAVLTFFAAIPLYAGTFHELKTVSLLHPGFVGFDIYQKVYFSNTSTAFLREQSLLLALSKYTELGIHIPFINSLQRQDSYSRLGDLRISVNTATDWFRRWLLINFYGEFNAGTGPSYFEETTTKMEAYGFSEWTLGFIFMKKFKWWVAHLNVFYVIRGARGDGEPEKTLFNGMALNIFEKESWQRWLGFSPKDERNFFYSKNFTNDIMQYNIAGSSDLLYPLVFFTEMTFSHDFRGNSGFDPKAPGSGIPRWQIAVGSKFFMVNDRFALKTAVVLPIGELHTIYDIGMGLGAHVEF